MYRRLRLAFCPDFFEKRCKRGGFACRRPRISNSLNQGVVLLDSERVAFRGISHDRDGNGAARALRIYKRLKSGFCP